MKNFIGKLYARHAEHFVVEEKVKRKDFASLEAEKMEILQFKLTHFGAIFTRCGVNEFQHGDNEVI